MSVLVSGCRYCLRALLIVQDAGKLMKATVNKVIEAVPVPLLRVGMQEESEGATETNVTRLCELNNSPV